MRRERRPHGGACPIKSGVGGGGGAPSCAGRQQAWASLHRVYHRPCWLWGQAAGPCWLLGAGSSRHRVPQRRCNPPMQGFGHALGRWDGRRLYSKGPGPDRSAARRRRPPVPRSSVDTQQHQSNPLTPPPIFSHDLHYRQGGRDRPTDRPTDRAPSRPPRPDSPPAAAAQAAAAAVCGRTRLVWGAERRGNNGPTTRRSSSSRGCLCLCA